MHLLSLVRGYSYLNAYDNGEDDPNGTVGSVGAYFYSKLPRERVCLTKSAFFE